MDSLVQPSWVCRAIESVHSLPFVTVTVVVVDHRSAWRSPAILERLQLPHLLYRVYTRVDNRLFGSDCDAFATRPVFHLLRGCPIVSVDRTVKSDDRRLTESDISRVRGFDLDVALNFGLVLPDHQAAGLATYGVWSIGLGEAAPATDAADGFWEVADHWNVIVSSLTAVFGTPAVRRILYQSPGPADYRSVRRSRSNAYWKASDFFRRKLQELFDQSTSNFDDQPNVADPTVDRRYRRLPSNRDMIAIGARMLARAVLARIDHLRYREQWFISVARLNRRLQPGGVQTADLHVLLPPPDRFWADPFPVKHGGTRFVFVEEYTRDRRKAHIAVIKVGNDGFCEPAMKVLQRDYHLSYPFVFAWEGIWYMLPETRENRSVELYRAESFPFGWQLDRVLLSNINAADATIAQIRGLWWMFVNVAVPGTSNVDELYLFSADHPLGPWKPHRRNPVKSDVRSARPAGRIIRSGGVYYRPAQDCSGRYGRAIVINRIVRLDLESYSEAAIGRIEAADRSILLGTHTLNIDHGLMCLDGMVKLGRYWPGRKGTRLAMKLAFPSSRSWTDQSSGRWTAHVYS